MMKSAYGAPPGAPSAGTGQFMSSYGATAGAGAGIGANVGAVAGAPPSGRSRIVSATESVWLQVGTSFLLPLAGEH